MDEETVSRFDHYFEEALRNTVAAGVKKTTEKTVIYTMTME
jgi:hypothetical protein